MSLAPYTNLYTNPTGLIDQKFGKVYEIIECLSKEIPVMRHLSAHLEQLYELHGHVDALLALQTALDENTDYVLGMKVNVPATSADAGMPVYWAVDQNHFYTYVGDGSNHLWRRVNHVTW